MIKHLILGSGSSFIVSFISAILLARLFDIEFIGAVKLIFLYVGTVSTILTWQIHSGVLYFSKVYEKEKPNQNNVIFLSALILIISSLLSIPIFYSVFYFTITTSNISTISLILFSIYGGFNVLFIATPSFFAARKNTTALPYFMLFYTAANLFSLLFTFYFSLSVEKYAFILFGSVFLVFIFSPWREIFQELSKKRVKQDKHLFSYSLKLSLASFFDSIADKVDKFAVSFIFSSTNFAKYSVLAFELPVVNIILSSFGMSIVRGYDLNDVNNCKSFLTNWSKAIRKITFFTYPMALFIYMESDYITGLLFGEKYSNVASILGLYSLVTFLRPAPFQSLLRMTGLASLNIIISLVFLIVSLVVCIYLYLNGQSLVYYPLAYLSGWFSFNFVAIFIFTYKANFKIFEVLKLDILIFRITQCVIAFYFSNLIANDFIVKLIFYSSIYLFISILFEIKMIREIFRF